MPSANLGVQRIAQGIGEQGKRRHKDGHHARRRQELPPDAQDQLGLRLRQHRAPADHVNGHAQPQERQNHFGFDEADHMQTELNQNHMADIGQNVYEQAREMAGANRFSSADIVA